MGMFVGVPWQWCLKRQWGHQNAILVILGAYIFGTFRAKANIHIEQSKGLYSDKYFIGFPMTLKRFSALNLKT